MMKAEYVLNNFELYSQNNKGSQSEKELMINIYHMYIKEYKSGNKLNQPKEKEVIKKMIEYFQQREDYIRCEQLKRIL